MPAKIPYIIPITTAASSELVFDKIKLISSFGIKKKPIKVEANINIAPANAPQIVLLIIKISFRVKTAVCCLPLNRPGIDSRQIQRVKIL
jgi:hypothetical protein